MGMGRSMSRNRVGEVSGRGGGSNGVVLGADAGAEVRVVNVVVLML